MYFRFSILLGLTLLILQVPNSLRGNQVPYLYLANSSMRSVPITVPFDFYVDSGDKGTAPDGSKKNPYHTIQAALNIAKENNSIKVNVGNGYNESFTIETPGLKLIGEPFDLKKPKIFSDADTIVVIKGTGIVFQGFRVTSDRFRNAPLAQSTDIRGIEVRAPSDWITVSNNLIHTIGRKYDSKCICPADPEKECPCAGHAHGINAASYTTDQITNLNIAANELFDLHLGRSEAIAVNGNVSHFTVSMNRIHTADNIAIDIGGKQNTCPPGPDLNCQANTGIVTDNEVSFIFATLDPTDSHFNPGQVVQEKTGPRMQMMGAIYVDGGTQVSLERNIVYQSATGIDVGSEKGAKVSDIVVRNNLCYNNKSAGIKIGNGADSETIVENCQVVNNTVLNNNNEGYNDGSIRFGEASVDHFKNITVANNIVSNANKRWLIGNVYNKCYKKTDEGHKCDGPVLFIANAFFSLNRAAFYNNSPEFEDRSYDSFATRFGAQATNFEAIDFDSSFYLSATSKARDLGVNLWFSPCERPICVDLAGRPRIVNGKIDVGAIEFQ